jgi:mitochondrial cardiolipin hydrolase
MAAEVFMTREESVAARIERLIEQTTTSVEAALYRFNNPRLARILEDAARRKVEVRLLVDQGKYKDDKDTRKLLSDGSIPFRPLAGRKGSGSKMHHKFLVLDGRAVVTGSYNWTLESEEENYDNLIVLRDPDLVAIYRSEFEVLWRDAAEEEHK